MMSSNLNYLLSGEKATSFKQNFADNDKDFIAQEDNIILEKTHNIFSHKPNEHHASGIKHTLHGSIYQLKLLMLFVRIGVNNNYQFRLATEMTAAEKFDDLVFQCQNGKNGILNRFLQAKHKQDESQKITANDLLSEKDDDFSLQKYFMSFRRIKQNLEFQDDLQDFILCTNINLDFDKLEQMKFKIEKVTETDDFFPSVKTNGKLGARYKLILGEENQMYEKLRETSDIYMLAKELVKHIKEQKPLNLTNCIIKAYHTALVEEQVIVIEEQTTKNDQMKSKKEYIGKFNEKFINYNFEDPNDPLNDPGLSESAKKLREILQNHLNKIYGLLDKDIQFKLSSTFGKGFEVESDPQITDVERFTEEIVKLVGKVKNNVILIDRGIYRRNAKEINAKVVADNLNKLAGHVLIIKDEKIQFRISFLDESAKLSGNLEEFRSSFKITLQKQGINLNDLSQYQFKIGGDFKTCEEEQLSTKKVLPNDKIEDEEIKEFFEKLVFAVNQPNEIELSDIIKHEMGEDSKFNLINANLITDSFEIKMMDWFKEKGPRKGKEGTWISHENVQIFFDSIEAEVNTLVTVGLSSTYPAQLEGYGLEFKNENASLKYFLTANDSTQIFIIFSSTETILSAIKVLQTLKLADLTKIYKQHDSYIFMSLRTILLPKIQQMIIEAFESTSSHNLLVIDCDCEVTECDIQEFHTELSKIINSSKSYKKKIILITKKNNALSNKFKSSFKFKPEVDYNTRFTDLTQLSQNKLLEKPVVLFQEECICLNELIDQRDENIKEIINSETLVKLMKNEKIRIGNKPKDLGDINDYYISRSILTQVCFNKARLKEDIQCEILSDFFVISGTDSGLAGITNNIFVFDNINDEKAGIKFRELCDKNFECNIHWLKSESEKLILQDSKGSISSLLEYREINKFDRTENGLTESKYLNENKSKILIIADSAGKGKSTMLSSLSMKIKKENPSLWVIRVDLNDFTTELGQAMENRIYVSNLEVNLVDFLLNTLFKSQEHSKLTTELEIALFKNCVNGQGKIAFLFDGFDEISPNYQDIVIDVLQALKKSNVEKLFVTTRPNMRTILEKRLEVFSHVLEPFSEPDQIIFFTKFWIKKLKLEDLDQERKNRLNTYASSLIERFSASINDKSEEFIGIPLQTMMLAEIFQENTEKIQKDLGEWEGCKEFLANRNTSDNPKLPKKFNLLSLYKHFVKKKFYEFNLEAKEHRDFTKSGAKKYAEENFVNFLERHHIMALSKLLSDNDLKKLLSTREIQKLKDWIKDIENVERNEGIIDKIIDNKPHFIHRTFAEYFASFPLSEKMQFNSSVTCSVVNSLVDHTSPVFISSIAEILNKEEVRVDNCSILNFITRNKKKYLKFLNALLETDYQDDLGKTSLHYAVQYNCKVIIENILKYKHDIIGNDILKHGIFKNKEYENSNIVKFVNIKDNEGKTALDYADDSKLDLSFSFKLLLRGASIDGLTQQYLKKLTLHMLNTKSSYDFNHPKRIFDDNILRAYANQDNKFRPIQEKLLTACPEIFPGLNKKDQSRLLSYFFLHGRLNVIHTLLNSINDENERKLLLNAEDNSSTPLDRVNNSYQISDDERLKIIKYLLKNGGIKVLNDIGWSHKTSNSYITTILQASVQSGHIKTFKYFINMEKPKYYYLHFYYATNNQQSNIIKYLLDNHRTSIKKDGCTALHTAVDSGDSLKIIKDCIENGEDINAQNDQDETPLFYAGSLKVIKYLVKHGADLDISDKKGRTVLYYAIQNDKPDIIKYLLLECKAKTFLTSELIKNKIEFFKNPSKFDFNIADQNGTPRLHLAIQSNELDWAKFMIKEGANINITDREAKTPLHWAAKLQQTEIVELLLQYGASFDAKDINHSKPCDLLSHSDSNKITWLLNILKTLFSSQNLMNDLDDMLLKTESGTLKDWGEYGSGHPDAWDCDNPMLFILNAKNAEKKTLFHIAADTNDHQTINILLNFNIDYLGNKNISPRYKYFQSTSIDAMDSCGNTPLHLAAQKGYIQVVCLLLEKGAIFNAENLQIETPKELAKINQHINVINLIQLTEHLFAAVQQSSLVEVKNCINKNVYINAKDKNGKTLLHLAVSSDKSDIVQYLLNMKANIDSLDMHHRTPLHEATKNNKIDIVKLLLKNGARYNIKDKWDRVPFELENNQSVDLLNAINELYNDIESDNPELIIDNIKTLQENYKIDISTIINVRDNQCNTILHHAAKSNEFNIVEFLLENGAIFDGQNKFKETCKSIAKRGHDVFILLESIEEMFENTDYIYNKKEIDNVKIIINVRNQRGKTLLHNCAAFGKLSIVNQLVRDGASVNSLDSDGKTPLHFVAEYGRIDLAKFLIENGADVNVKDKNEKTAMEVAREYDNLDIVQFLVTLMD